MTKNRTLLVTLAALAVFTASIVYRAVFCTDLSGAVCYEIEAAHRMLQGQIPFRDFYFDLPLTLPLLRMPTVWLAQLLTTGSHLSAAVLSFKAMAIASFIEVSLIAVLSFALCIHIVVASKRDDNSQRLLWFALLGFAFGNFAMGYSYGCAQHIFALLLSPYLFLRLSAWLQTGLVKTSDAEIVDTESGADSKIGSVWLRIFCGLLAGFAASFDPLFIFVPITIEALEFLSRRLDGKANTFADEFFWLLMFSLLSWSYLLVLDKVAMAELVDWIIPLKYTSYYLEQMAYFGLGATPDRRDVIYLCTIAAIIAFGIVNRLSFLRPIIALMMAGFVLYQMGMSGLSSDILLAIWATCMAFSVEICYLFDSSFFVNLSRRYPKLSYRRANKARAVGLIALCAVAVISLAALEVIQRHDNLTVWYGPMAIDPTYLELADSFPKYCCSGDSIMIINGRLLPNFPLYSMTEKPIAGYFISTEPFSSLANIEAHNLADHMVGKPFGWIVATKKKIFDRLRSDIDKEKPGVIAVEGGQTFEGLEKSGIIGRILVDYTGHGEARYHSRCVGAKEFADWNYRYNIYERKKADENEANTK
ncbi:hypothetical protein BH11CYA1_BH11CYA1_04100 [soil metagenome]